MKDNIQKVLNEEAANRLYDSLLEIKEVGAEERGRAYFLSGLQDPNRANNLYDSLLEIKEVGAEERGRATFLQKLYPSLYQNAPFAAKKEPEANPFAIEQRAMGEEGRRFREEQATPKAVSPKQANTVPASYTLEAVTGRAAVSPETVRSFRESVRQAKEESAKTEIRLPGMKTPSRRMEAFEASMQRHAAQTKEVEDFMSGNEEKNRTLLRDIAVQQNRIHALRQEQEKAPTEERGRQIEALRQQAREDYGNALAAQADNMRLLLAAAVGMQDDSPEQGKRMGRYTPGGYAPGVTPDISISSSDLGLGRTIKQLEKEGKGGMVSQLKRIMDPAVAEEIYAQPGSAYGCHK